MVVNSTFTESGMRMLWPGSNIQKLYPPVRLPSNDPEVIARSLGSPNPKIDSSRKANLIISVAQFRPEKNHQLQVAAVADLLLRHKVDSSLTIMICGSCRPGSGDADRVRALVDLAEKSIALDRASIRVIDHTHTQASNNWPLNPKRTLSGPSLEFHLNLPFPLLEAYMRKAKV